jgi:hypothetical protein
MNAKPHDNLDDAIDAVAARLTKVSADEGLAQRIVASLPDRSPWLLRSWIPRLAFGVLALAGTLAVLRMGVQTDVRTNVQTNVQTGVQTNVPTDIPTNVPTNVPTDVPAHALSVARPNARLNDRPNARLNDRPNDPDFDRSLAAIAAPSALSLEVLAPSDLPVQGALVVEPLTIDDLALTSGTLSPALIEEQ